VLFESGKAAFHESHSVFKFHCGIVFGAATPRFIDLIQFSRFTASKKHPQKANGICLFRPETGKANNPKDP
jgi:hypothetical protein